MQSLLNLREGKFSAAHLSGDRLLTLISLGPNAAAVLMWLVRALHVYANLVLRACPDRFLDS